MSHVSESRLIWGSHDTHEWVMSRTCQEPPEQSRSAIIQSVVAQIDVQCLLAAPSTPVPWLIHTCHDSFIRTMTNSYVPWHIHMCHDTFICAMTYSYVPWLIHKVQWLIHMWHDSVDRWADSTNGIVRSLIELDAYSHVWHDSFICVTWLIHICDMTNPHVWYDSFIRVAWLTHL